MRPAKCKPVYGFSLDPIMLHEQGQRNESTTYEIAQKPIRVTFLVKAIACKFSWPTGFSRANYMWARIEYFIFKFGLTLLCFGMVSCSSELNSNDVKSGDVKIDSFSCKSLLENGISIPGQQINTPILHSQMYGDIGPITKWSGLDLFDNGKPVIIFTHSLPIRPQTLETTDHVFDTVYVVEDPAVAGSFIDLSNVRQLFSEIKLAQYDPPKSDLVGTNVIVLTDFPEYLRIENLGKSANSPVESMFSEGRQTTSHGKRVDIMLKFLEKEKMLNAKDIESLDRSNSIKHFFGKFDLIKFESNTYAHVKLSVPLDLTNTNFNEILGVYLKLNKNLTLVKDSISADLICAYIPTK